MVELRMATPEDAEQMLAFYAPFITDNAVSFEMSVPTLAEFKQRVATVLKTRPWLACEAEGRVVGYAYAGPHRVRETYQWSTEVSIYIDSASRKSGVGTALYTSLFACLRLQGYRIALAGITTPNPGSQALHARMGFEDIGTFKDVGYKLGSWQDVWWCQLSLGDLPDPPRPPMRIGEVSSSPAWRAALAEGQQLLR
jgi:L-amino acid N-acyltransferase YncA